MPDRDDSRPVPLRAVGDPEAARTRVPADDPVAQLGSTIDALESKLQSAEGLGGMIGWLHEAEDLLQATSGAELDRTRNEIRELIDELLELNAKVQNVVRLKQLFS